LVFQRRDPGGEFCGLKMSKRGGPGGQNSRTFVRYFRQKRTKVEQKGNIKPGGGKIPKDEIISSFADFTGYKKSPGWKNFSIGLSGEERLENREGGIFIGSF